MVYDMKADLICKVRLVYDSIHIDPIGLLIRVAAVKIISVCLLNIITDS